MKLKNLLLLFSLGLIKCSKSQGPISIHQASFQRLDTFRGHPSQPISLTRYFVVANFLYSDENEKKIDSFAKNYMDTLNKFETNLLIFFKQCNNTTVDTINIFPDFIHRHAFSHDLIYEYSAKQNGKIYSKLIFRNGQLVDKDKHKMEVEIIPPPNSE